MKTPTILLLCLFATGNVLFSQTDSLYTAKSDSLPFLSVTDTILTQIDSTYDWISYKGKAAITKDNDTKTCQFFMVNRTDSLIYLLIHISGIELARTVLTPDKVTYVNKLSREYYQGDYSVMQKMLKTDINYFTVQTMLTHKGEVPGEFYPSTISYNFSDSTVFFDGFTVTIPQEKMRIDVQIKDILFNIPGPTTIKIPPSFNAITKE